MHSTEHASTALTLVDESTPETMNDLSQPVYTHPTQWTPAFIHSLDAAKQRVEMKRQFFLNVMDEDLHYGRIPGAEKPTLFKPGAELLLSSMGLSAILSDAEQPIRHYGPSTYGEEPIIAYRRICQVFRQTGPALHDRVLVAQAEGFCSSRETKYRYRDGKRLCPDCGKGAIRISKFERGGFYCHRKEDGCGLNFDANDTRITSQQVGRVLNPDIADLENTILKMSDKRAYVAATLLATGCSDIFTQDIEDDFDEHTATGASAPKTPVTTRRQPRTHAMTEKMRRRFLQAVGDIALPDAVVVAVVQHVTNKTAHRVTDPSISKEQGKRIVDELRSIRDQRAQAQPPQSAPTGEAPSTPAAGSSETRTPVSDRPSRPATQRPAAATATATAGAAHNLDALRARIRAIAHDKGVDAPQLDDLAKRASRGYAKSLDDPKFNPRDAQALVNLLNGNAAKYGEPSFAA